MAAGLGSLLRHHALFGTGGAVCLFHALGTQGIPVGDATTLYATTPLWVAVLSAPLLGERGPAAVWGGVALGFVGVATLLKAGFAWSPTALLLESALFHRVPQGHQILGAGMVIGAGVWVALRVR